VEWKQEGGSGVEIVACCVLIRAVNIRYVPVPRIINSSGSDIVAGFSSGSPPSKLDHLPNTLNLLSA
jgi:hypothetical protein